MAEPFDPKKQFQANTVQCQEFAEIISRPVMDKAFTTVLAMLLARGLAPDRLAGVPGFIDLLRNLADPDVAPKPLPTRHLTSLDEFVKNNPVKP